MFAGGFVVGGFDSARPGSFSGGWGRVVSWLGIWVLVDLALDSGVGGVISVFGVLGLALAGVRVRGVVLGRVWGMFSCFLDSVLCVLMCGLYNFMLVYFVCRI